LLDKASCIATYFGFHQLPELDEPFPPRTFEVLTPVLHETFARVILSHEKKSCAHLSCYERLSDRDREIGAYIGEGMSNGEIANVLLVRKTKSETTSAGYSKRWGAETMQV
jgi:FixJ family two-component response regulator